VDVVLTYEKIAEQIGEANPDSGSTPQSIRW
jgi:hypothetical protein